ncbi:RES domain-containing protein [Chitinophaga agrisoli]|uniref:RES domain-containing protein n=1 Tax=Chitinophaga agrisoli TaxID=2607653 RepID=A0A5B2VGZ5_9BACT|nr:RES domain-containing protein [Chitinophaga agrisoli]KAA2238843.1 RES domain-containing protein [Chitinophaga agrisoli]
MHCYDFITDEYQYQLKAHAAATTRSGRFEDVLRNYKNLFLAGIGQLNTTAPSAFMSLRLQETPGMSEWFDSLLGLIRTDMANITKIFDEVIDAHQLCLRSKHYLAVLKMQDLLECFDLLQPAGPLKIAAFYRGRAISFTKGQYWKVAEGVDCRTVPPYYHLPFNMRNLCGHHRFSISGVPMLYLGNSIMTVYYELGNRNLDAKNIGISQYGQLINDDGGPDKQRYFDITNDLFDRINNIFSGVLINGDKAVPAFDEAGSHALVKLFRRFILSQLCTFPRASDGPFAEEYLIPQILTEAVKMLQFDGILFPSTEFNRAGEIVIHSEIQDHSFKNNLAVFTEYDGVQNFDRKIGRQFYLQVENFEQINGMDHGEALDNVITLLQQANQMLAVRVAGELSYRTAMLIENIRRKLELYAGLYINGQSYLDTFAGRMEILYMEPYIMASIGKALQQIPVDNDKMSMVER